MCQSTAQPISTTSKEKNPISNSNSCSADGKTTELNNDSARSPTSASYNYNSSTTSMTLSQAQENLRQTVLYGSLSMTFLVGGASICMPYTQSRWDELNCDALCQGSMTSARSFLHLVGAAIIGRLSDGGGIQRRKFFLILGAVGSIVDSAILSNTYSMQGMWWGMVSGALLQQNFSILKATVAECYEILDACHSKSDGCKASSASVRASSIGKIGMSVGLAFMVGPLFGGRVVQSFDQAVLFGIAFYICSILLVYKIPHGATLHTTNTDEKTTSLSPNTSGNRRSSSSFSLFHFLDLKSIQTPAALFFVAIRTCMALAFRIFNIIWTPSLKQRFQFGPADYGQFFSFIGIAFAISQGFIASRMIHIFGPRHRITLILLCCIALSVGRWFAFQTQSLTVVYILFAMIITALGVMNTIITADTSKIASADEIGGLMGLLDAVESGAGMAGPMLGGILGSLSWGNGTTAPLLAVISLYALIFVLVLLGYDKIVTAQQQGEKGRTATVHTAPLEDKGRVKED